MGQRRKAIAQVDSPIESAPIGRSSLQHLAATLQDTLTQRLTAYIAGISDGRDLGRYARGERSPHLKTFTKLNDLFNLVSLIKDNEPSEMIQVWFLGRNPEFG